MASVDVSPSTTPALPGAWASNWTLARAYRAASDSTPISPRQDFDGIRNENTRPAILDRHDLAMGGAGGVRATFGDMDMSDVDDGPLDDAEEDFYSFVSHGSSQEDTDVAALFPSSSSITRADPSDGAGAELREPRRADSRSYSRSYSHSHSRSRSHFHSGGKSAFEIKDLQLGSRARHEASLATLTQEEDDGDVDGECGPDFADATSSAACVMGAGPSGRDDARNRPVCHSLTGASMDPHAPATPDDDDMHVEEPDDLAHKEDVNSNLDSCSARSGYTAGAHVREFIRRLSLSDAGEASPVNSVGSLSHSSDWHCAQRTHGAANRPGALHNSTSILHLAQPSGDSPWTLALDPARPSDGLGPCPYPLSRPSSRTTDSPSVSLSDESSIAFNSTQMHAAGSSSDDRLPSPSYRQSPAARVRARYYNEDYEIRTVPRYHHRQQRESEYSSSYSSPQAPSFPTASSSPSASTPPPPFVIYAAHNDPLRTKASGVIQKTKALCSKLKRLVTRSSMSSVPPPPAVEYDPFLSVRRNAMDLAEHDVSPPLPYLGGRPPLSLYGHQGFQRTTKVSTVSVPLARRVGHRRMDAVDVYRAYEPSIPGDEEEVKSIKASRRLSLPVFMGTTSGSSRSRRFSTFQSNRRPRLSMISATHID